MSDFMMQLTDPNFTRTYASAAAEQKPTIKAKAGMLLSVTIMNVNAAARVAYIMDALNDATPFALLVAPQPIAIGATINILLPWPRVFKTGLTVASSSGAAGTYTASGTGDFIITAHYV